MVDLLTKAGADPRKGKRGPPGKNDVKNEEGGEDGEKKESNKEIDPEEKKKKGPCCGGGSKKKEEETGNKDTGLLDRGSAV